MGQRKPRGIVGSPAMSSVEALNVVYVGRLYGQCILPESVEGHFVPNLGFLEDVVVGDPSFLASNQPSDSLEGATCESDVPESCINNENTEDSIDVNDSISDTFASSTQNDSKNSAKEITTDDCDLKSANVANAKSDIDLLSLSIEEVDSHLDSCLAHDSQGQRPSDIRKHTMDTGASVGHWYVYDMSYITWTWMHVSDV
ncbi:hypothetical protein V6N13_098828 [Hibiscus sabdariffa]